VKAVADPESEAAFPAKQLVEVIIETTDGKTYSERREYPKAIPAIR